MTRRPELLFVNKAKSSQLKSSKMLKVKAKTEAIVSRTKLRPNFWPRDHFGLEDWNTSVFQKVMAIYHVVFWLSSLSSSSFYFYYLQMTNLGKLSTNLLFVAEYKVSCWTQVQLIAERWRDTEPEHMATAHKLNTPDNLSFFIVCSWLGAASEAVWSSNKPPSNLFTGQSFTMCDIDWMSPQMHNGLSV